MLKKIFILLTSLFVASGAFAQGKFSVAIVLDSSIDAQRTQYQYYDGKNTTFLPDTFGTKRVVVLKGRYYSPLASLHISYNVPGGESYGADFFLDNRPAKIVMHYEPNKKNELIATSIQNATLIYDIKTNATWAELQKFKSDSVMAKENRSFDEFLSRNKGFSKSDSLMQVFKGFYKRHINWTMGFLKKHPSDYFSFWYFINQIAQTEGVLKQDTPYLKEQLAFIKTVFPGKFVNSIEGRTLIKAYERAITPPALQLNNSVPLFTVNTMDGKTLDLKKLRGRYVLLDFWATWCAPCLAELPFIRKIKADHPAEQLIIIGISADIDKTRWQEFVKKNNMNWPQVYDQNREIGKLYGVEDIPFLVLIDKDGKAIYLTDHKQSDTERLPLILKDLK